MKYKDEYRERLQDLIVDRVRHLHDVSDLETLADSLAIEYCYEDLEQEIAEQERELAEQHSDYYKAVI